MPLYKSLLECCVKINCKSKCHTKCNGCCESDCVAEETALPSNRVSKSDIHKQS